MNKVFYPYKYSSLLFYNDILDEARNIGWRKCRKYKSWHDLHVNEDDGEILSEAGDSLVEEEYLDPALLEHLYEIWLKASTYNPKNKEFDKPIKVRKEWEQLEQGISLCREFPEYSYREISVFFSDDVLQEIPNPTAKLLCYLLKIKELIEKVRYGFLPDFELREFYKSDNHLKAITDWIIEFYDEVEFEIIDTDCPFAIVCQLLNDLGIEGESEYFYEDTEYLYRSIENSNSNSSEKSAINYVKGGGNFLFRIIGEGTLEIIEVDEQHPFVDKLSDSAEVRDMFESFARAYFHAKGKCGNFSDNLFEDFTSYLSLKLKGDHR